jgi:hypothetical protein
MTTLISQASADFEWHNNFIRFEVLISASFLLVEHS